MSAKRLYAPSIDIDGNEFKCLVQSVGLEPGAWINFCEQEWTFTAAIELGYGASDSWNILNAMADTIVTVTLKPEDDAVAVTNPGATFDIRMPSPSFMVATQRGNRMVFNLSVTTEAAPVFATA